MPLITIFFPKSHVRHHKGSDNNVCLPGISAEIVPAAVRLHLICMCGRDIIRREIAFTSRHDGTRTRSASEYLW